MKRLVVGTVACGALLTCVIALHAQPPSQTQNQKQTSPTGQTAQDANREIKAMFGFVPTMFSALPEDALAPAWDEMRALELGTDTALPPKTKELISLGVSAQIPCRYCVYACTQFAGAQGATDREIKEAVAMAALTRHWSTVLNGNQIDEATFNRDTNNIFTYLSKNKPAGTTGTSPTTGAPTNGAPTNGAPTNGAPTNGAPTNGAPTNGAPKNSAPTTGAPKNNAPTNGAPTNGAGSMTGSANAPTTPITDANSAYQDIQATLGSVPMFLKVFPQTAIAPAWREMKAIELSPNTALDGKTKELIGLAVAAQIPCQYCVRYHTAAAKYYGATQQELQEAVAMSALARHWSTILYGSQQDEAKFKRDIDQAVRTMKKQPRQAKR
jgi:AhpD family alkylhydroperoxidase